MSISKETEEKIQQLQLMEQNLQNFMMQKQTLQMQMIEAQSALEELAKSNEAYKILGNIMVKTDKETLTKDLESKKETSELRIKTIEKQEAMIRDRASKIQKEVLEQVKE